MSRPPRPASRDAPRASRIVVVGHGNGASPRLDAFAAALAAAGMAVSRQETLPEAAPDAGTWVVVCTGPVEAPELEWIARRWGSEPARRAIPLGLTLRGASEALARSGAPAAIERRGYAAWAQGASPRGRRSGLVCRARDAEDRGLPVHVAMDDLVATGHGPPLPEQLVSLLAPARTP